MLIFYGLGTIIGAGVYVLIGEVASRAGNGLAIAFLTAGIIAAFTACSYAELSARYPQSAGAALYIYKATNNSLVFQIVGWAIVFTGLVSAATISRGFVGYFQVFFYVPDPVVICTLIFLMTLIAAWGIRESASLIVVITLLEIGGIIFVIGTGIGEPAVLRPGEYLWEPVIEQPMAILIGTFLAFYAFIGFEDMVNIAEEARNPVRDMPIAIIISMILATLLYIAVAVTSIRQIGPEALAASRAPLAELVSRSGYSPALISFISMIAVVNGALVQIIMASRVLYGMGTRKLVWIRFAEINQQTQTPVIATVFASAMVLILALLFPIGILAQITSTVMLCLFTVVNISLIVIKHRKEQAPGIQFPMWVPIIATGLCLLLLLARFYSFE
jgi:amino acid transporter